METMLLRSGRRLRRRHEVVRYHGRGAASDRRGLVSQPGPRDVDQREEDAGAGVGEDRISALPNGLLLQVLAGLGSTAEAARTGILARRWSSLWPSLDVLVFRGLDSDTLRDLLSRVRRTQVSRLEIRVPRQVGGMPAVEVTSLLQAAEEHSPAELIFELGGGGVAGAADDLPFELPWFRRSTSIELRVWNRLFTLPPAPAGQSFSSLKRLSLTFCSVNPDVFLPYCPHLCVLDMCCYWMLDTITISSGSLKEILLRVVPVPVADVTPQTVNVYAAKLMKFKLQSSGNRDLITSLEAPTVDSLSFSYCSQSSQYVGFGSVLHLMSLSTSMEWSSKYTELHNPAGLRIRVLSMVILSRYGTFLQVRRSFMEEIRRLPVNNFSILMLHLRTGNRSSLAFGTLVLELLKTLNIIQKLQLFLPQERRVCSTKQEYDHYMDDIRRNRHISLTNLEVVEIKGFDVTDHDLGFLNIIFKSAPMLKIVRIELLKGVLSDPGYMELYNMFSANDSVKCFVNGILEN